MTHHKHTTIIPELLTLAEVGELLAWPPDLTEAARKRRLSRLELDYYRIGTSWLVAADDIEALILRSRRTTRAAAL